MFSDCEIDDESMTQLGNKIENEALYENCEMDDATFSLFVARYDMSFDLSASNFFDDLIYYVYM